MRKFLATRKASSKVAAAGTGCFRHEITLFYFRAGVLPASFERNRRALAVAQPQACGEAHARSAPETHRTGQADAQGLPYPFRQAGAITPLKTETFRDSIFLFRFLSCCFTQALSFTQALTHSERLRAQTRCRAGDRRGRIYPRLPRSETGPGDRARFPRIRRQDQ